MKSGGDLRSDIREYARRACDEIRRIDDVVGEVKRDFVKTCGRQILRLVRDDYLNVGIIAYS